MDWFCIVIGLIFIICLVAGWIQGLFKLVVSVAGLIVSLIVAIYVSPHVSGYMEENTRIDDEVATYISKELKFSDNGEETSKGIQVEIISELPLPQVLKSNILDNNNSEMYEALDASGVYEYISKSIAVVILNAMVFLVLVIICRVFFFSLGKAMGEIAKLPIIRSVDKIGGGILGAMKGLIIIWIVFLVLSITSTFSYSQEIIQSINQNELLKLLYDNNLLLDIVADLTKVLFL